jgi:hypothetical protein
MNTVAYQLNEPTITATQSYTWVLREAIITAIENLPFFTLFNIRRTPQLPSQSSDIPLLGVFLANEPMMPDGDANAGNIGFMHDFTISFLAVIKNNDPDESERKLDEIFWALMNGVWRDQYLTNMLDTRRYPGGAGTPDNTRFEGIIKSDRPRNTYGVAANSNETPIAQLHYNATMRYRSEFAPVITTDLLEIYRTTGIKAGDSKEEMAKRLQAQGLYVFTPE